MTKKELMHLSSREQTDEYFNEKSQKLLEKMPSYVKDYIRAIHNRISPRTKYEYLKDIESFIEYYVTVFQTYPTLDELNALDKKSFEIYFEHIENYSRNGQKRKNGRVSIKRKMSALRNFFDYLFKNELINSAEIRKVEMPKLSKKQITYLDKDESKDLINTVKNGTSMTKKEKEYHDILYTRDLAILYLLLSTGIRVSECAELDIDDIDLKKCSVLITRKGGSQSIVYFSDEALPHLQEYMELRQAQDTHDEKALFLSSRKKRMSVRTIEIMIKKYAQKAVPLKKITPHKLRATYATNLYEETNDIYLVAEMLGHKDVKTTKEHYANISNKHKSENRNKIKYDE